MIIQKAFFRKTTTKLNLLILSLLMSSTILLFLFGQYYYNLSINLFQKTSYLLIASKTDHYQNLIKYKKIRKIERAIIFNPNYELNKELNLKWSRFIIGGGKLGDNSILAFPNYKLNDGEIELFFNQLLNENYQQLEEKKLI